MSLLLEALKRAEEDSRSRKLATVAASAPSPFATLAEPVPAAKREAHDEWALEEPAPAQAGPAASPVILKAEPPSAQPPAETDFSDLALALVETPAAPAAAQMAGPSEIVGKAAVQAEREAIAPAADSVTPRVAVSRPPERIKVPVPIPVTTPRQAKSAAGVMAGTQHRKTFSTAQRRKVLLVAVVLVVALPVAAFLLFGDALFDSPSKLLASNAPRPLQPLPVSPPVSVPAVPAAVATAVQETVRPVEATVAPQTRVAVSTPSSGVTASQAPKRRAAAVAQSPSGRSLVAKAAQPASLMESAYAAYQADQPGEATRLYREVLKADPTQRDAWLGLAVIAHASNQREPAMDAYKRVLRLEPQNATALAGISSLSRNVGEPQQESKLRELLARTPQEADLNHALGLLLSGEQRWSEAQPLFFKAHALAPQNPQFAYNLAVTLDHLRKSSLAVQYYETALGLAQGKAAAFDEASARSRLAVLKTDSLQGTLR